MSHTVDPSVFTLYLPMYRHRGAPHRQFPWWFMERQDHDFARWRRVDGELGPLLSRDDSADECALIDQRNPLPVPSPMPGQVWTTANGGAVLVVAVDGTRVAANSVGVLGADVHAYERNSWPPAGGALVLGPSPWGRDVPWVRIAKIGT